MQEFIYFVMEERKIMYTASADWMTRNLDRRIEVAIPILDPDVYKELRDIINIQLRDNTKARLINTTQSNPYKVRSKESPKVRAQLDTYRYIEQKCNQQLSTAS